MKPLFLLLIVPLFALTPLRAAHLARPQPNILVILADDLGYGQPKCYREGTDFNAAEGSAVSARIIHSTTQSNPHKS